MSAMPTVPKPDEPQLGTCDWGWCNRPATDSRWSPECYEWLSVCAVHSVSDMAQRPDDPAQRQHYPEQKYQLDEPTIIGRAWQRLVARRR